MSEFDSSVGRRELPAHLRGPVVSRLLPRRSLATQFRRRLDPLVQALPRQHAQLDLRHGSQPLFARFLGVSPKDRAVVGAGRQPSQPYGVPFYG
jgi:hypothetical protein